MIFFIERKTKMYIFNLYESLLKLNFQIFTLKFTLHTKLIYIKLCIKTISNH